MKRTAFAIVVALAALGLLVSLAFESRPLPVEVHVSQYTIRADLDHINDDYRTLVTTLSSAWNDLQPPGEGARALLARIESQPQQLPETLFEMRGSFGQEARLRSAFDSYNATIGEATRIANELLKDQSEYAAAVAFIRESGGRVIQEMRDLRFERAAADVFQLVVGTLDFAGSRPTVQEAELRRLLVALGRDQQLEAMPADVTRLRNTMETVVSKRASIRSKLEQLSASPVIATGKNLGTASQDLYKSTVARVDQARLMLAVYAVVLLLAVGFAAIRLHASYREINRANHELAVLNESLEQRVSERTDELAGTISNLKESQVQLVQAEKMSSLGQLVAGISHEINTPLLYIANNAELMQERIGILRQFVTRCLAAFSIKSEDFATRAEYQTRFVTALKDVKLMLRDEDLEASLSEAEDLVRDSIAGLSELTEMAQSLKDFSRLDRAPIANFDVNAGLDKTLLIAKNVVKHKANVRKFYGKIPEIQCSPSQINQVFLNIITNAAQAIEKQGEIVITTKLQDSDHVAIRVADTGCGIPEENLSRIRDPFFTTKDVGTGTGLGLSIVDEIIRSHNGELLVESVVGKGSAFTVVLPIKHTAAANPADSREQQPALLAEAV
ncbi:MAG TPA: ATP-binding protein [Gammaproteobacteria bacterium]|nr:ATP-binding protein [Gammaproteobacteria bacterium]